MALRRRRRGRGGRRCLRCPSRRPDRAARLVGGKAAMRNGAEARASRTRSRTPSPTCRRCRPASEAWRGASRFPAWRR
eukprot:178835-Alexandrium_andersonii.AAC.1